MPRSRPVAVALLTAIALCAFAAAPAAPGAGAATGTVRVGAAPSLPAGARAVGAAPDEQLLRLYVALEPRDPAALERFATAVSTPNSPAYGQYLSVPELGQRFGGTSAAAPLWAAAAALINANPACAGRTIGFANPALYEVAASDYAANFDDVTASKPGGKPTTDRYVEGEPFPAGPYYDMASGLGTPIAPGLAASLCALANPPAPPAPARASPPAPAPTTAPSPPAVGRAALTGIAEGKPKLVFTVTARSGAELQKVVVQLPPALLTESPANTIRFEFRKPRTSAKLKLSYPAIRVSPKLREHFKSGVTKRLGFVVATRESGGKGARLPLVLALG
jgi:pro-kumamolisin-like protein